VPGEETPQGAVAEPKTLACKFAAQFLDRHVAADLERAQDQAGRQRESAFRPIRESPRDSLSSDDALRAVRDAIIAVPVRPPTLSGNGCGPKPRAIAAVISACRPAIDVEDEDVPSLPAWRGHTR
jgi:hypothetical protein